MSDGGGGSGSGGGARAPRRRDLQDLGIGVLFVGTGSAVTLGAVLAARNGFFACYLLSLFVMGPLLVLMGLVSTMRFLFPPKQDGDEAGPRS